MRLRNFNLLGATGILAIAAVALTLVVAACGSSGSSASSSSGSASPTAPVSGAAALVPSSIRSSGVLSVGTQFNFPPMESYATGTTTPVGLDVDIMTGIAKVLGLKLTWVNMDWDGLRPALETGRFDAICASMGDFTDRQKQVTFVDYLNIAEDLLVLKANAARVTNVDYLSGKTVSAETGTCAAAGLAIFNKQFRQKGLKLINVQLFPTDAEGVTEVQAGRVFGHVIDAPSAIYEAKTAGNGNIFSVALPGVIAGFPYGIAVNKNQTGLANAIKAALDQMISNGSYGQLMTKYGTTANAVKEAAIDGGTRSSGF